MAKRVTVTADLMLDTPSFVLNKGDVETFEIDFRPWQADNATVTAVSWTVEYGQAGVAGQSLSSGVASARVSVPESGSSQITIAATAGSLTKKIFLRVKAKDIPSASDDYGYEE